MTSQQTFLPWKDAYQGLCYEAWVDGEIVGRAWVSGNWFVWHAGDLIDSNTDCGGTLLSAISAAEERLVLEGSEVMNKVTTV